MIGPIHPSALALSPRARLAPPASIVAGSLLAALPIVASTAALPPFGLLLALAWRLLRPELWSAWTALPLGLVDDLLTGQPLGSGMAMWTLAFLVIDRIDRRFIARDHWADWLIAGVAATFILTGGLAAAGLPLTAVVTILPQIALTILAFPVATRIVARIDRWRLAR